MIRIHKGCGGEITSKRCDWDDCFEGCSECDQHEYCEGWEIEEITDYEYWMRCEKKTLVSIIIQYEKMLNDLRQKLTKEK